jgi:hypothetical protein
VFQRAQEFSGQVKVRKGDILLFGHDEGAGELKVSGAQGMKMGRRFMSAGPGELGAVMNGRSRED